MSESKLLLAKNGPLGWIIFNCQDYQEGVKAFSEKRRPQFQGR
jgi:hypothetical protein